MLGLEVLRVGGGDLVLAFRSDALLCLLLTRAAALAMFMSPAVELCSAGLHAYRGVYLALVTNRG